MADKKMANLLRISELFNELEPMALENVHLDMTAIPVDGAQGLAEAAIRKQVMEKITSMEDSQPVIYPGIPVVRVPVYKTIRQWYLRVNAYARLAAVVILIMGTIWLLSSIVLPPATQSTSTRGVTTPATTMAGTTYGGTTAAKTAATTAAATTGATTAATTVASTGAIQQGPEDGYLLVIDKLMQQAEDLQQGVQYLAIDTTRMVNLTVSGKERLFRGLERYNLILLDKTLQELEDEEYIKNLYFEKGLLVRIDDLPIKEDVIVLNASIYRSGTAAYGTNGMEITFMDGRWAITDPGDFFIS